MSGARSRSANEEVVLRRCSPLRRGLLFLRDSPIRRSVLNMILGAKARSEVREQDASASSAIVASGWLRTSSKINASPASSMRRTLPCRGRGSRASVSRSRRSQRLTYARPTPNRAAASSHVAPSCKQAAVTRARKSREIAVATHNRFDQHRKIKARKIGSKFSERFPRRGHPPVVAGQVHPSRESRHTSRYTPLLALVTGSESSQKS